MKYPVARSLLATLLLACGSSDAAGTPAPAGPQEAATAFDQEHTLWTGILRARVHEDGFDYGGLKKDPAPLQAYLKALHAVTPAQLNGWSQPQRFAFWINAYNAHTIQKVVENYPIDSIKDLSGALGLSSVFDKEFIPMRAFHPDGKAEDLSLNDIEHGILRKQFKDARVHAAINCASHSCPRLRNEAFVASRLDEQLDQQMRTFVNDPVRNHIDPARKELAVSEIFKWFSEDFERDAHSVKEFLIRYAPPEEADFIRSTRMSYLDYGWKLNDSPSE